MNLLDVNVLVALYRPDHAHHRPATVWWAEPARRAEEFTVPDPVWVGFVRTVTNARIYDDPATFSEAWQFAEDLMARPTYRHPAVDARALGHFVTIGQDAHASGNLVTDAYIAGCAVAIRATVVTFDRDFRKFDGLRVHELTA